MSRRFPDRPVASVGAVVVGAGGVVLVKRANAPLAGEWSLPGGMVELGETMAVAIKREVHEETGLDVDVGTVLDVFDRIHPDASGRIEYHYLLVDFLCRPIGGQLTCGSDAAAVRWVAPEELPRYGLSELALGVIAKALELAQRGV